MKHFLIKLAVTLWVVWVITLMASCASQSPARRYAREHQSKEFTDWDTINKKSDKAQQSKPKEHSKKNRY